MLKSLYISNYALISELQIDFEKGFSVITGETGAGKSIIIGALSLILGQRAESKTIKTDAEKCVIEAELKLNLIFRDINTWAIFSATTIWIFRATYVLSAEN